jgi:hypothetical protein
MPRVLDTPEGGPTPQDFNAFYKGFKRVWEQTARIINGGLSFGAGTNKDNIDGAWIAVTTPAGANTDFAVTHNLGRIPVGYIVMTKSAACDIYTGSVGGTTTQLTLRGTVNGVTVTLFVI